MIQVFFCQSPVIQVFFVISGSSFFVIMSDLSSFMFIIGGSSFFLLIISD